ncbi:MAG: prepilin-type N-terminal cleavage/methylation domain-containing protein [Phycisphaerales bacterium]|nr:prepilin-type N-terminal cleavage/methylation domain-containing protein [Phycisphaerales bacterium]
MSAQPPEQRRRESANLTRAMRPRREPGARRGFTLLESALATVIIGVGVLALVEAQQTFTRSNGYSTSSATATHLANELRERMRWLPRHDPVTGLYVTSSGASSTLNGWGRETGEVVAEDFNDIDDFDGVTFGAGGNFPGPIDAFSRVIQNTLPNGQPETGEDDLPVAMRGWSQRVDVQKIDPFNSATVRDDSYLIAPSTGNSGVAIDQFPLRVTVSVFYQGPLDVAPQTMARVVWIVPR